MIAVPFLPLNGADAIPPDFRSAQPPHRGPSGLPDFRTFDLDFRTPDFDFRISDLAQQIIALPERGMGRAGSVAALDLIEPRLVAAGLRCVRVPTTVSVAVTREAWLEVDGKRLKIFPLAANRAATAGLGSALITGRLVLVGAATPAELAGVDLVGAIAVLHARGAQHWRICAEAGAAAVLVTGVEGLDRVDCAPLSSDASVPFPRFALETTTLTSGMTARLRAEVAWEPRRAWSLVGVLSGKTRSQEAVIISSGYEADGPIAGHCPGATRAWNAAALVDLATRLAADPPERSVVLVLGGGRAEMFSGLRHICAALTSNRVAGSLDHVAAVTATTAQTVRSLTAIADALSTAPKDQLYDHIIQTLAHAAPEQPRDQPRLQERALLERFLASAAATRADAEQRRVDTVRFQLSPRARRTGAAADIAANETELARLMPPAQAWRTLQQRLDRHQDIGAEGKRLLPEVLEPVGAAVTRARNLAELEADAAAGLEAARALLGSSVPVHCLALDLSDGSQRFASITAGFFVTWKSDQTWMHRGLQHLARDQELSAFDHAVDLIPGDRSGFWTDNYLHESGLAGLHLPAVTLSTTDDARLKLGSPADRAEHFRAASFLTQYRDAARLVRAWIDSPELTAHRFSAPELTSATIRAEVRATGTVSGRRPLPFAHAWLGFWPTWRWQGDVKPIETRWCDQAGEIIVPFLPRQLSGAAEGLGLSVRVYGYDAHGAIAVVPASAGLQAPSADLRLRFDGPLRDVLAVLFPAEPSVLFAMIDPRLMQPLPHVGVLAATRQAAPDHAHIETEDGDCAIWTEPGQRLMVTATQGYGAHRLLLLGEARERSGAFAGRPAGLLSRLTAHDAASDLWRLDDQRLTALRHSGVEAEALTTLHARAERHLANASAARERGDRATARGEALSAWAYAGRVYPGVLAAGNDVVHGLVVLLLLAVPCAWMLERLLLAAATVTRRVLGFIGSFIGLFFLLFALHPAATLAITPLIILLSFIIILMSAWVIAVLHVRFEHEMASLRQGVLGSHAADVRRLGALVATVELGASNMRRRPLRTVLTVVTVVLMTFTLLTFAGFNPALSVRRIQLDAAPAYEGILVRRNGWAALSHQALDQLEARWGDRLASFPLRWLTPNAGSKRLPVTGPAGTSNVLGLLGVSLGDPSGIERALIRGAGPEAPRGLGEIPADGRDWIFLPPEVLKRCGVEPGGIISWRGVDLRAGTVDARILAGAMQLGGELSTPIAEEALAGEGAALVDRLNLPGGDGAPRLENTAFIHQDPAAVAVLRASLAQRYGAELHGVTLTPRSPDVDLDRLAEDMAQQLALTLRVGRHGETWLYTGVGSLTANGLGGTLVPLVLGGLIVFATMLGAVAERGREIFIYASLGLAPLHIATLFLVEAGIYAVLGALGGYLLAQLTVWILGLAAHLGLLAAAPDLNYSSTAALATIVMVMAAVLISALYPALMAARAAHPGGRRLALPAPAGDTWTVPFPVTVPIRDVAGILAFLAHWLNAAGEAGNQSFTAGEVALDHADDGDALLRAKVWLAPFDLGLSQTVSVEMEIIDLPGSRGMSVHLERRSGGNSDWKRANVPFLREMRRQVLLWRTLEPEVMDLFRAKGGDDAAAKRVAERKT